MLDPKFVIENLEKVAEAARKKNMSFDEVKFSELYAERLKLIEATESLRRKRNEGSEAVKKEKDQSKRQEIVNEMRDIGLKLSESESALRTVEVDFERVLLSAPSIPSVDTPVGKSEADNVVVRKVGQLPNFDFEPKDHIQLGIELGLIDFQKGARVAGSRSYFLIGALAQLERAVHSFALDLLMNRKFTQLSVPVAVKTSAMLGTGYLPAGKDQAYYIEKDDLWLVGTSEVSLASYFAEDVFDFNDLPVRVCAYSSCFRREAGAHGKDTKGLYRVHQFQKIEQVVICPPSIDHSDKLHLELLTNAEDILKSLELPYQVVQVCTGDLGQGQVKKNDVETWMPSRNSYGETHSCSSFYDFQARRLKIKVKDKESGKLVHCFTLNNTAVATPRLLIALMENHQKADGSISIPPALQPYMNGLKEIRKNQKVGQ